jgi:hypothetical protein
MTPCFLPFMNSRFLPAQGIVTRMGVRRCGAKKKESVRKHEAYWQSFCPPGLLVPMMNRLRPRKGNGNIACRDTTRSWAPQSGGWVLGKVCMVKAGLPEPQSPAANRRVMANAADTPFPCEAGIGGLVNCRQSARRGPHQGITETNKAPKHTATPRTRNCGIA